MVSRLTLCFLTCEKAMDWLTDLIVVRIATPLELADYSAPPMPKLPYPAELGGI